MPQPANYNRLKMAHLAQHIEEYVEEGARETVRTLVRTASSRSGVAPGAAVDQGELRGSVRITLDGPTSEAPRKAAFYPIVGDAEVDRGLESFRLGSTVFLKWIAAHANIIEGGRRPDKNGRMIGSDQNPDGFLHLAIDETGSVMKRWRYKR